MINTNVVYRGAQRVINTNVMVIMKNTSDINLVPRNNFTVFNMGNKNLGGKRSAMKTHPYFYSLCPKL